jgi:large subunit ribosomal protein L20
MRSVNNVASRARRKRVLEHAKGFWGKKKNVWTVAKNQVEKSWQQGYVGRKNKKRDFRSLWIQRINAGTRTHGISYSVFISGLAKAGINMDRKVLADLAMNHPEQFSAVVEQVKKHVKVKAVA